MEAQSAVETRIVPFSCIEIFHKFTFYCSFSHFLFTPSWSGVASLLAYGKRQGDGVSKYSTLYCVLCSCLPCSDPASGFLLRCENLDRVTSCFCFISFFCGFVVFIPSYFAGLSMFVVVCSSNSANVCTAQASRRSPGSFPIAFSYCLDQKPFS